MFTNGEFPFFIDGHVGGRGCEALSELIGVIALHGHADPWKLHPDPSFVIVIGRRFLVELKFFDYSLCIQIFKIFEVFWL